VVGVQCVTSSSLELLVSSTIRVARLRLGFCCGCNGCRFVICPRIEVQSRGGINAEIVVEESTVAQSSTTSVTVEPAFGAAVS
jgi:hypothetical protein